MQLLTRLKRVLRGLLGRQQPPAIIAQHPFDSQHGVNTSGLMEARQLRTGHPNDAESTAYFGVPPSRFRNAVARWQVTDNTAPIGTYRLVDIGCGKGRAVLLASRMGFRDVVGVELHPDLAATAVTNLRQWQLSGPTVPTAIVCADAPSVLDELLEGPVLLYIYNPFRAPVLRQLLQAIQAHPGKLSSPVDILYLYPAHEDVFREMPQFQLLWHEQIGLSSEDEGDGISAANDPCSLYRLPPLA